MATTETWTLDSVSLTGTNFDILELTVDPPKARPDWLTAADSDGAALMRQPLHENRIITMKMRVRPQASMNAALDAVGTLIDKLRLASSEPAGIALTWTPANSTRTVTFDVLAGEIQEMPIGLDDHARSWFLQRPIFTVEMTAKPYWRGTETLTSTASSSTPQVTLEVPNVTGDVPALGRLIVTDTATQARKDVEWGIEGQFYNSGTSLILDSDSMTVTGFAGTQTTSTGAYDPNATGNNVIRVSAVLSTPVAVCGTGNLSHIGVFRVWARVKFTTEFQRVRFAWRDGEGLYSTNAWAGPSTQNPSQWTECDLGLISLTEATLGTQRWDGRIEAMENPVSVPAAVDIDYLLFIPASEGYGRAKSAYVYSPGVTVGYDLFTSTTSGNALNARVATQGGTWATSGETTDFVFADQADGGETLGRTVGTDATTGRFAILGSTNYTDIEVSVQVVPGTLTVSTGTIQHSIIARYTDASNYLLFRLVRTITYTRLEILKRIAGVSTIVKYGPEIPISGIAYYTLRLVALANGRAVGQLLSPAGGLMSEIETYDTVWATGGALATGKPGISDVNTTGTSLARYYDTFVASTPQPDLPVIYSTRTIQFRHDGVTRTDSAGTVYGDPPSYKGTRFLVPVGTSRVAVAARRVERDTSWVDNVADATQVQVGWTPRGLVVPRA